jgi:hypothetical protein
MTAEVFRFADSAVIPVHRSLGEGGDRRYRGDESESE